MITVGELLKKERLKISKSIEEVALETKIQPRFIQYLENNEFNKFDSNVYAQGFIKIYAKYLDINEDRILAIYRRSVPKQEENGQQKRETKKKFKNKSFLSPKPIALFISILFVIVILSYIGYQIYLFQSPPQISIQSPSNDTITEEENITIIGSIESNSSLFINDDPVLTEEDGAFNYEIKLNPGNNTIRILAKKNNSTQENIETIRVTYTPLEEDEDTEVEEIAVNTIKLITQNSSAWIQLNIDKENKLSQIIPAGEEFEYEIEETLTLTTGRINSTSIYFNNELIPIPTNNNNVGSLSCEVDKDNQILCE